MHAQQHRHIVIAAAGLLLVSCASNSAAPGSPITNGTDTTASISSKTVPTTSVAPTSATQPVKPGEEWVAYQAHDGDRYGIELIRSDGTGAHFAFPDVPSGTEEHPDWSPDGSRIVFTIQPGDDTEDIWMGNADGTNAAQLIDCQKPCVWADEPAWSPDGTQIAFQRGVDHDGQLLSTLELLDVHTGSSTVVVTAPSKTVYLAPRWAPDGKSLAVEAAVLPENTLQADPVGDAIGVLDLAHLDRGLRMVTDEAHMNQNPDWSPDGRLILFAAYSIDGQTALDLFTVLPDGTGRTQVTHFAEHQGLAKEPTFTPDGTRIVFSYLENVRTAPLKMATVALDGTDLRSAVGTDYVAAQHPRVRPLP